MDRLIFLTTGHQYELCIKLQEKPTRHCHGARGCPVHSHLSSPCNCKNECISCNNTSANISALQNTVMETWSWSEDNAQTISRWRQINAERGRKERIERDGSDWIMRALTWRLMGKKGGPDEHMSPAQLRDGGHASPALVISDYSNRGKSPTIQWVEGDKN